MQHTVLRTEVCDAKGVDGGRVHVDFLTYLNEYEFCVDHLDLGYRTVMIKPAEALTWAKALVAHLEHKVRTPGTVSE